MPCNPVVENLKTRPADLHLLVVPGADGETSLYEDEGDTQNYTTGGYTTTLIRQQRTDHELLLTIEPRQGQFDGMLAERSYQVQLLAEEMPQSVRINDLVVDSWSYDADQRMLTVTIPSTPCDETVTLSVQRATTGIQNVENRKMQQEHYYDLQGRRLSSQSGLQNTVGIVRRTWADGRVTTHKIVRQ